VGSVFERVTVCKKGKFYFLITKIYPKRRMKERREFNFWHICYVFCKKRQKNKRTEDPVRSFFDLFLGSVM
jgi:hypothetical protein